MKAVVLRDIGDIAVMDVPIPDIGAGQALVRMTECGICGSDVRYMRGDNPWAKQTLGEKHINPPNMILGHEVVGVVERVADDCGQNLVGRRVALLAFGTCGTCYHCSSGEENLCAATRHLGHGAGWGQSEYYYGGMAEYVPVYCSWLFPLKDNVSDQAAVTLDPLGVAVHGLRMGRTTGGDSVLVIGCGAVGSLAVSVARAWGAKNTIAADVSRIALKTATGLGADVTINPEYDNIEEAVRTATNGMGARVVLDTIGADLDQYLPLLARGGRYVIMTVTERLQSFNTSLLAGERSIVSSCNFRMDDYSEAINLLEQGLVPAEKIITHRYQLEDAIEAFRVAEEKSTSGAVKVVLEN